MTSLAGMKRSIARGVAFGVALATVACGSAPPLVHHYRLVVPPGAHAAPAPPAGSRPGSARASSAPTLGVEPLRVDAAYDTERIVYRVSPYRLDYYEYHRWAAHPGLHVGDYLRTAYAATGLFRDVVIEPDQAAEFVLGGRIIAIEEIDESDREWTGRIAMELWVRDRKAERRLWSATYDRYARLPERSPEGLARALSGALHAVATDSAQAVFEALTARTALRSEPERGTHGQPALR